MIRLLSCPYKCIKHCACAHYTLLLFNYTSVGFEGEKGLNDNQSLSLVSAFAVLAEVLLRQRKGATVSYITESLFYPPADDSGGGKTKKSEGIFMSTCVNRPVHAKVPKQERRKNGKQ